MIDKALTAIQSLGLFPLAVLEWNVLDEANRIWPDRNSRTTSSRDMKSGSPAEREPVQPPLATMAPRTYMTASTAIASSPTSPTACSNYEWPTTPTHAPSMTPPQSSPRTSPASANRWYSTYRQSASHPLPHQIYGQPAPMVPIQL